MEYIKLDPVTGTALNLELARNLTGSGDGPGSAWDWNGDGMDDYYIFQSYTGKIVDGLSGGLLHSRNISSPRRCLPPCSRYTAGPTAH